MRWHEDMMMVLRKLQIDSAFIKNSKKMYKNVAAAVISAAVICRTQRAAVAGRATSNMQQILFIK
jgi:hypothetical protein